jgi:hypothetical protein
MQIIMGKDIADQISDKYIVLELDTVLVEGQPVPAYAVLDAGSIPLGEMQDIPTWTEHHNKLMENYRKKNWDFCEQMIDHCQGRWGGELNSFYIEIYARVQDLKHQTLPEDWDGTLVR